MQYLVVMILSLGLMMTALADEVIEVNDPWKNSSEIGAVQTSGNTHTLTLNAKTTLSHESERFRDTFEASAHNSSDRQLTTAEKYTASLQDDWKVSERDYLFLRFGFESDRFSGFRQRTAETIGYGRDLIVAEGFKWNMELGAGLRQNKLLDKSTTNETIVRGATLAEWELSESASLKQSLSTEGGKSGWASKSVTGLKQKINSHLASNISLTMTHNSKVPVGTKHLDLETAINMVVGF